MSQSSLHSFLKTGMPSLSHADKVNKHRDTRVKIVNVNLCSNLRRVCSEIILCFIGSFDTHEFQDEIVLLLIVQFYYAGDAQRFKSSIFCQQLLEAGYQINFYSSKLEGRLLDCLAPLKEDSRLAAVLKNILLPTDDSDQTPALFALMSMFLPKLMVGAAACATKVGRTVEKLIQQGICPIPPEWVNTTVLESIYRVMRASYILRFAIIHHALEQSHGSDSNERIIHDCVMQARFAGMLLPVTMLTHILVEEPEGVRLHLLARSQDMKEELTRFQLAIRSLLRHGRLTPFARILGLPEMALLEHGHFPKLSAIAMGVASVHTPTLNATVTDPRYEKMRRAAEEAERALHDYQNAEMVDNDATLSAGQREILKGFHKQRSAIRDAETTAAEELRRETITRALKQATNPTNAPATKISQKPTTATQTATSPPKKSATTHLPPTTITFLPVPDTPERESMTPRTEVSEWSNLPDISAYFANPSGLGSIQEEEETIQHTAHPSNLDNTNTTGGDHPRLDISSPLSDVLPRSNSSFEDLLILEDDLPLPPPPSPPPQASENDQYIEALNLIGQHLSGFPEEIAKKFICDHQDLIDLILSSQPGLDSIGKPYQLSIDGGEMTSDQVNMLLSFLKITSLDVAIANKHDRLLSFPSAFEDRNAWDFLIPATGSTPLGQVQLQNGSLARVEDLTQKGIMIYWILGERSK
ncbi:TPA: nucleoprotein [Tapajos virus]|uniref:Nucleoprotein n=1 Tax=Tapajos virus TaxID=2840185 RepID=A0AAD3AWC2_9MONO|nr:nucleoprotein [Tapajos virus]FAA04057.1 TPA: nucleoprotein [Tapajos virus]